LGGTVFFAGILIKKLFDKRTAIITLPFIALSPFLLRYGFELRMYSLSALICIAATYVLVCALESKKDYKIWGLYAILVALGVYTHYYTVLLWTAHLVWLIWQSPSNKQSIIKSPWIKAYLFSVILFIPWMSAIYYQIVNGALASVVQSMTIDNLVGIVSFAFLYQPVWQLSALSSLIIMIIVIIIHYLSRQVIRFSDKETKRKLMLLVMYLVVPVIFLTVVGLIRPMYLERYLVHVILGGYMFIGVSLSILLKKKNLQAKVIYVFLMCMLLVGVFHLDSVGNFSFQGLQHPETKYISTMVNCDNNSAILAADPYTATEIDYYFSDCPIYFYSDNSSLGGGYAPIADSDLRLTDTATQLDGFTTIYYVYYDTPKLQMPVDMESVEVQKFGTVNVEKYQLIDSNVHN
jgi:uncharacterized membrane protein